MKTQELNLVNRFKAPPSKAPTNSRWKRSSSPEIKINTFKTRRRGGGRGHFRNNRRGRGGPSIFDNVKRDQSGRPMLKGSTTQGFDITSAMNIQKPKISNKERKKQKKHKKRKRKKKQQPEKEQMKKRLNKMLRNLKQTQIGIKQ